MDKSWGHMLKCVNANSRKRVGTRVSGPRFSDADVRAIRASKESLQVLSIRYGRDKRVIGNIKQHRTYKDVV